MKTALKKLYEHLTCSELIEHYMYSVSAQLPQETTILNFILW